MTVRVCCEVRLERKRASALEYEYCLLSIRVRSLVRLKNRKLIKLFELRAGYLGGKGPQQLRGLPLVLEKTILKEGARKRNAQDKIYQSSKRLKFVKSAIKY